MSTADRDPRRFAAPPDITGIANPLRMLRLHRGLTLAQCAWLAGTTLNKYSGWERRPLFPAHLPAAVELRDLLHTTARVDIEPKLEGFSKWHRHANGAKAERQPRFASLHVTFQLPAGVTQADARAYVINAVRAQASVLEARDPFNNPMVDLDRDTVKVHHAPHRPKGRASVSLLSG